MADKEQRLLAELEATRQELEGVKQETEALTRGIESRDATITTLEQADEMAGIFVKCVADELSSQC